MDPRTSANHGTGQRTRQRPAVAALLGIACAALLAGLTMANVSFLGAKAPAPFETPPPALERGEFTWSPPVAPAGPILVVVSLEAHAQAYRNHVLIGATMVSTGKKGQETPTGLSTTILRDKDHRSSKYNHAPMPCTRGIFTDGVALHTSGIPGNPESHRCVHLPSEIARLLFEAASKGLTVVISGNSPRPRTSATPASLHRWTRTARAATCRASRKAGHSTGNPRRRRPGRSRCWSAGRMLRLDRWAAIPVDGCQAGSTPTAAAHVIRRIRIPAPWLREACNLPMPGPGW